MNIRYMSDLHLEGAAYTPVAMEGDAETTLILAGDIHVGIRGLPFLRLVCEQFKYVIYVFGNHEFYHSSIPEIRAEFAILKNNNALPDNLHILDNSCVTLEGTKYIGTTLWTDLRKEDPMVMYMAKAHLNDFHVIFTGADLRKLYSPSDSVLQHKTALKFLHTELQKQDNSDTIVVTHHLPSYASVASRWRVGTSALLNGCFYSDLDYMIEKYKPSYWIHGHTHDTVHEVVDQTIILCNPKGYGRENQRNFNPEARFEK